MPQKDRYIESTINENKFFIGQIIVRYGKKFRITRIVEDTANDLFDIYGIEIFD